MNYRTRYASSAPTITAVAVVSSASAFSRTAAHNSVGMRTARSGVLAKSCLHCDKECTNFVGPETRTELSLAANNRCPCLKNGCCKVASDEHRVAVPLCGAIADELHVVNKVGVTGVEKSAIHVFVRDVVVAHLVSVVCVYIQTLARTVYTAQGGGRP
jgi:hypothetical protein